MSLLKKTTLSALRNLRPKSGHTSEKFWSAGKQDKVPGFLFNETPPPPGVRRKWESWEPGWYAMLASMVVFVFVYPAKPDTNLSTWAKSKAMEELASEGVDLRDIKR